jgi:hypothetical protein
VAMVPISESVPIIVVNLFWSLIELIQKVSTDVTLCN